MPTLQDGRNAIEQGNLSQARLIFEAILQENPRSEDAWLGLAEVLTEPNDKRICYENVLKINRNNRAAREALRNLEPQQDPLVAALAGPREEGAGEAEPVDESELDQTMLSEAPPEPPKPQQTQSEMSTTTLVILGLVLSLVVFAVGGGLVYVLLQNLL